jgi:hypothetical protein
MTEDESDLDCAEGAEHPDAEMMEALPTTPIDDAIATRDDIETLLSGTGKDAMSDADATPEDEETPNSKAIFPKSIRAELEDIFTRLDRLKPTNLVGDQRHIRTTVERDLIIRGWGLFNEYIQRNGEFSLRTGVSSTTIEKSYLKHATKPLLTDREATALEAIMGKIAGFQSSLKVDRYITTPEQQMSLVAYIRLLRKNNMRTELKTFNAEYNIGDIKRIRWEKNFIDQTTEELVPWAFPKVEAEKSTNAPSSGEAITLATQTATDNGIANATEVIPHTIEPPLAPPPNIPTDLLPALREQDLLLAANLTALQDVLSVLENPKNKPETNENESATIALPGGGVVRIGHKVRNLVVLVFGEADAKNAHDEASPQ